MGILQDIFGTKSVIENGMKAIDALVFTDEEKSNLKIKLLNAYEPFKKAQRLLAFMFGGAFLLVFFLAVFIWTIGVFTSNLDMQGFYMEAAFELAKWNTDTLGTSVMLIFGFYFAGGAISSFQGK